MREQISSINAQSMAIINQVYVVWENTESQLDNRCSRIQLADFGILVDFTQVDTQIFHFVYALYLEQFA